MHPLPISEHPLSGAAGQPALWRQLQAAASVLRAQRAGQSGSAALDAVDPVLRPGVQSLAFAVWRNLGRAMALRAVLAAKPPPAAVDALLCVTLALCSDAANAPYDEFTLVNQAVEAAKRDTRTAGQAAFVNACLRRFLRERASLVAQTDDLPQAQWNHPAWWIQRLQAEQPQRWQSILQASNTQAPLTLRVNLRQTSLAAFAQALAEAGMAARTVAPATVYLERAVAVARLPGYAQGWFSVQDAAAQRAAPLLLEGLALGPQARVLDACAAPGGKTGHLLEITSAQVTALEYEPARVPRIHANLQRLGLQAQVLTGDAGDPAAWWDGQLFDAVLLDAPCTASGIVRRHPDVRWLRREADIGQLAQSQKRLMDALWPLLRVGGRMLYCTCSVFAQEGPQQVQAFLARHSDARALPADGSLWPQSGGASPIVLDNAAYDHDGFFYGLLEKHPA
ncbi:MAG: 16S rRNA (cytosine(967)-C(5))-methyltransferase RsmB [Betaproteobacteria bacterium]|nr:16S rRNA (cytosine(967)-C(5))-methyltransferase RsmB [Betaproteobacteria bacterium]